jgi:hypothetical protein
MSRRAGARGSSAMAGVQPLAPRRKWRAITLSTLILAPSYWALLIGVVSVGARDRSSAPMAGPYIALGLAAIPFVFLALAFLSEHPRAASATFRAMALSLAVGIPVSALAADAVTGWVAGIGAGGIMAMRSDLEHSWKPRALAILIVSAYVFVLARTVGVAAALFAPVLPFTSIGVADHLTELRRERRARTS